MQSLHFYTWCRKAIFHIYVTNVFRSEQDILTMDGSQTDSNMNTDASQDDNDGEVDAEKYFEPKSVLSQAPRSPYWAFFKFKGTEKTGPADSKILHCMLCLESENKKMRKKDMVYTGGTTNLKSHLEHHHKEKIQEIEEKSKKSSSSQQSIVNFAFKSSSSVKKWPKSSPRWVEATRNLAIWIITSSRPYDIVSDPGFLAYSNFICPEFEVPCRMTITRYIEKLHEEKKRELKSELEPIEFVAATTDGGSSTNAISFQDVNVHYINSSWKMKSATLAVKENKGSHDADRYKEITDEILEDFGVSDKVVLTVTDNEPKMRAAFNDEDRSGCCAHIIHSTTSKGLKEVPAIKEVTGKTRKVATKHNKSCNFRYSVEREQAKAELKKRPIIQDVEHRWGSTKSSTESFLNHKDDSDKAKFANFEAVNCALRSLKPKTKDEREKLMKLIFSLADMKVVETLHGFLKELDVYSTNLGADFYVTSSVVIPTIKSIENLLKPDIHDPFYMADMKRIMMEDIKDRVKKNINFPMMIKSSALDCRFKKLKFIPSDNRDQVFDCLKTEAGHLLLSDTRAVTIDERDKTDSSCSDSKKRKVELNYNVSDDEDDEDCDEVAKEIQKYKKEDADEYADPLKWWREREAKYPILSRLAKKYLSIPATSVEAERRFSDLGLLLTKRRLCMTGDHVDMCLFLKDKFRQENKK